jgi:PAS domain-containing protein
LQTKLSRSFFEEFGQAIPAGLIIIEKDKGKIIYVNERAIELFGFDPCELTFKEYALNMAKMQNLDQGICSYEELPLVRALVYGETYRNQEFTFQKPNQKK